MPGCSKSGVIERQIGKRVNECKADDCTIRIKDATDFQWDKMYVFKYYARPDVIQKALGTTSSNFVEFTRRIVFLKDGRIVYREDEPTDIESVVDGQVIFDIPDTDVYKAYMPDAEFRGVKRKSGEKVYYELKQIK